MQFFYVNGIVVLILIVYLLRRPKNRVSRLKLRNSAEQNKPDVVRHPVDFANAPEFSSGRRERHLNVIFQFNGHDFDAHEVLGIPAGSQWSAVEVAYKNMIAKVDSSSEDLYHHAFNAIRRPHAIAVTICWVSSR